MFQKNFCKISSKDSSRYFAIIIPSVLSVFKEIKNLRNIFYNVVFFSNCKILLQHHIIKTKMKQSIWGVEKKIFDMCEHYSYITFSVVIKIFQKKLVKNHTFAFFVQLYLLFFAENSVIFCYFMSSSVFFAEISSVIHVIFEKKCLAFWMPGFNFS